MEICPWLFGIFERFSESWLDCPRWWKMIMYAPWSEVFFHLRWTFSLRKFLFTRYSHVNFSVVEQITMWKQRYSNNAKFMLVLKFLKIHFSVKQILQESDINSGFIASPTGVRIPFVKICFRTNYASIRTFEGCSMAWFTVQETKDKGSKFICTHPLFVMFFSPMLS